MSNTLDCPVGFGTINETNTNGSVTFNFSSCENTGQILCPSGCVSNVINCPEGYDKQLITYNVGNNITVTREICNNNNFNCSSGYIKKRNTYRVNEKDYAYHECVPATNGIENFGMSDVRNTCQDMCSKINLINIIVVILIIVLLCIIVKKYKKN